MAAKRPDDRFSNLASLNVGETAAGTIAFGEMQTGISLGKGIGMLIDQIDYFFQVADLELIIGSGDAIYAGLATSDQASLAFSDRRMIHMMGVHGPPPIGTPASGSALFTQPFPYQFFPPMIVANPRLYAAVIGASLASTVAVIMRLYFRYIELETKEYLELAEAFQLVG